MLCPGCGQPLPERVGAERGRRPRYHGPACRQRARRARITSQNAALLAALAEVESAASALRAALLTGVSVTSIAEDLRASAEAVTRSLAQSSPDTATDRVTKSVTIDDAETKTTANPAPDRKARQRRRKPLDPDSVRLERSTNEVSAGWRVLAGPSDDATVLGLLEPVFTPAGRRGGGWQATAYPTLLKVPGGPWKTRQDALVRLVD